MPIVEVVKKDIITGARETSRDNAQCICITFENCEEKHLNFDVFSTEKGVFSSVLLAYQSLIGKSVRVTCWDPQKAPGRWSKNNWFKNVFVMSDNYQIQKHIDAKGVCEVCGIADGLLNYSKGKNNEWWHYRCIFPGIGKNS